MKAERTPVTDARTAPEKEENDVMLGPQLISDHNVNDTMPYDINSDVLDNVKDTESQQKKVIKQTIHV